MSKAKAKGTAGENEVVDMLVDAGFRRGDPEDPADDGVKRYEGGHASHDIQGVGSWVVEVKFRKAWHLFSWIRRIRRRADGEPWVIFAIHGDRRTVEGAAVGKVAIMDAGRAAELIYYWEYHHRNVGGGPSHNEIW